MTSKHKHKTTQLILISFRKINGIDHWLESNDAILIICLIEYCGEYIYYNIHPYAWLWCVVVLESCDNCQPCMRVIFCIYTFVRPIILFILSLFNSVHDEFIFLHQLGDRQPTAVMFLILSFRLKHTRLRNGAIVLMCSRNGRFAPILIYSPPPLMAARRCALLASTSSFARALSRVG